MTLCYFLLGIFSPKILANYGVLPDFLCVRFASLGVAVSFLSHRHWLDTLEVLRLVSSQVFCPTSSATSCEFLTDKVSGPQNAGPLERRVRPEGQKEAPSLGEGGGP